MKVYFLIIILSIFALWPFFKNGFFTTHDGDWMITRFSAFHQTLVAGQFPIRYVERLNNNYGYPVMNFLYPSPFYFSELPKLLGLNFQDSIKTSFVISTLVSSLAMFWALSQRYKVQASTAGAIIYLFTPYRFLNIYVRGSLGENFALALAPCVLAGIFIWPKNKDLAFIIIAISTGALITSHNILAVVFLPILIVLAIVLNFKDKIKILLAFFLGILTSTFFWLPALYDLQYVKFSEVHIADTLSHLVPVSKLISPAWGFDPNPNSQDAFSKQIGLVNITIIFISIYVLIFKKKRELMNWSILSFILIAVFLTSNYSYYLWSNIKILNIIQFPWRLLSLVTFLTSIICAASLSFINKKLITIFIVLAAIVTTILYSVPLSFNNREEGYYSTNEDTTTVKDEYMPVWVQEKPRNRADNKFEKSDDLKTETIMVKPGFYHAILTANADKKVQVNTIYFPGHEVTIDGEKTDIDYINKNGLITFLLPSGTHEVIIKYAKTSVHLISEIVSVIAVLIIICVAILNIKRSKYEEQ